MGKITNNSKLNKRGQFYILTALLLIIPTYTLISQNYIPIKKITNLDILSQNYVEEGKNTINNAIYSDQNVFLELDSYTQEFITYANTKNVDLQILYIIKYDEKIKVVNYLKKESNIMPGDINLQKSESSIINNTNQIIITYNNIEYTYNISTENVDFKALIINN